MTRPEGTLLVSVMSRLGQTANVVRQAHMKLLKDPDSEDLWGVINKGDLSGVPSKVKDMQQPAMHLYTADELRELFPTCRVLAVAGSNVSTFEGSASFEELASDPQIWPVLVEIERKLCQSPGLVDSSSHFIMALQRLS